MYLQGTNYTGGNMFGTSGIRGCYAYKGHLVVLSNGELGTYVHHRRCEDLSHAENKAIPENPTPHQVPAEEHHQPQG